MSRPRLKVTGPYLGAVSNSPITRMIKEAHMRGRTAAEPFGDRRWTPIRLNSFT